jgi:hypothetical protein
MANFQHRKMNLMINKGNKGGDWDPGDMLQDLA